jgi:hypothetical protein
MTRYGPAAQVVEEGDDVGVVELRDRLGLLLDPLGGQLPTGAVRAQGLERHVATQLRVEGLEDRAESPTPDLLADLESADPGSGPGLLLPRGGDLVGRGLGDVLEQPGERAGIALPGRSVVAAPLDLVGHVGSPASRRG